MNHGGSPRSTSSSAFAALVTLLLLAALALGAAAADAAGPTLCTGTLSSVSLHHNVQVPGGATCELEGSSITGNVFVEPGATLLTEASAITGNLQSSYGALSLDRTSVSGAVKAVGGGPVALRSSTFGQNVLISHEPGGTSPNVICASVFAGSLTVRGNYAQSAIGDPSACGAAAGNSVAGNLSLLYNTAAGAPAVLLSNNVVAGNLRCRQNRDPVFALAASNEVHGKRIGECTAIAQGSEAECTATSAPPCSVSTQSTDGSSSVSVSTEDPTAGTERILVILGPPPIGCTTAGTGAVATFSVTNPGPGEKTVVYDSYEAAAEAAEAAHPVETLYGEGPSFGYACYESPTSFTTFSGAPATLGPNGYYGQLPSCYTEAIPCVQSAYYYQGDGSDYRTVIVTPQSDPRLSH